jgi:microtubule-associated protein-like 1/2
MMITGGKDGNLVEWSNTFEKKRILRIPELHGSCRVIAQMSLNSSMLIVGTTRNCIYQVNFELNLMKCLVNGHFEELWGLSSRDDSKFLTCSNDKNLNCWDTLSHSLIWSSQFDDQLHSVHIHPHHDLAVISLSNKSKWLVYDFIGKKTVSSQCEGAEQIEVIRYSPSGLMLACGSRDNSIYLYNVTEDGLKYSRCGRCSGHSSFITHLDWSVDSQYLISNSGDYECLYWSALMSKQITQVQLVREIKWASHTCTISFSTFGIWNSTDINANPTTGSPIPLSIDGTDINACYASTKNGLLATVDDFGKLNLFVFPCSSPKTEKRVYQGHSSHVTNVAFVNNETRLISVGGNDMAVFQWTII